MRPRRALVFRGRPCRGQGCEPGIVRCMERDPAMVRRPWWPPRLADVAERSGVSLATASRALARQNGAEGALPQATEEILTAATELGYWRTDPDVARLHVLVSDIGRTGYWATLSGVLSAALDLGAETSLHVLAGSPERCVPPCNVP